MGVSITTQISTHTKNRFTPHINRVERFFEVNPLFGFMDDPNGLAHLHFTVSHEVAPWTEGS